MLPPRPQRSSSTPSPYPALYWVAERTPDRSLPDHRPSATVKRIHHPQFETMNKTVVTPATEPGRVPEIHPPITALRALSVRLGLNTVRDEVGLLFTPGSAGCLSVLTRLTRSRRRRYGSFSRQANGEFDGHHVARRRFCAGVGVAAECPAMRFAALWPSMVRPLEEGCWWFLITSSESVREYNATVGLAHPRVARLIQRSAAPSIDLLIDGPRWHRAATCRHGLVAVAKTQVDGTERRPPGPI
jgi:hypothetical protein